MGVFTTIFSSALVLVALTAFAEAGSYGGGHAAYSYAQYQPPQVYAYVQPPRVQYYTTGGAGYGGGYGYGAGYGLNAGMANAGGISGGIAGSIIPIVIICKWKIFVSLIANIYTPSYNNDFFNMNTLDFYLAGF